MKRGSDVGGLNGRRYPDLGQAFLACTGEEYTSTDQASHLQDQGSNPDFLQIVTTVENAEAYLYKNVTFSPESIPLEARGSVEQGRAFVTLISVPTKNQENRCRLLFREAYEFVMAEANARMTASLLTQPSTQGVASSLGKHSRPLNADAASYQVFPDDPILSNMQAQASPFLMPSDDPLFLYNAGAFSEEALDFAFPQTQAIPPTSPHLLPSGIGDTGFHLSTYPGVQNPMPPYSSQGDASSFADQSSAFTLSAANNAAAGDPAAALSIANDTAVYSGDGSKQKRKAADDLPKNDLPQSKRGRLTDLDSGASSTLKLHSMEKAVLAIATDALEKLGDTADEQQQLEGQISLKTLREYTKSPIPKTLADIVRKGALTEEHRERLQTNCRVSPKLQEHLRQNNKELLIALDIPLPKEPLPGLLYLPPDSAWKTEKNLKGSYFVPAGKTFAEGVRLEKSDKKINTQNLYTGMRVSPLGLYLAVTVSDEGHVFHDNYPLGRVNPKAIAFEHSTKSSSPRGTYRGNQNDREKASPDKTKKSIPSLESGR